MTDLGVRGMLTDEEYEDIYRETLLCLRDQSHFVGEPFTASGKRWCSVDGNDLDDHEILELWWGHEFARLIQERLSIKLLA
jgi:hypothetical protein